MDVKIHRKSRKSEAFFIIPQQSVAIWQVRGHQWIQRLEYVYLPAKQRSNYSWRYLISGFKNTWKITEIGGVFYYTSTTLGDMANPRSPVDSASRIGLFTCEMAF